MQKLDSKEGLVGLSEIEWRERYDLEKSLMHLYAAEEAYWQKRGGEKWVLEGDANTAFFHSVANGRRRKKIITSLQEGGVVVEGVEEIKKVVTEYYKKLFGSVPAPDIHLSEDVWPEGRKISSAENEALTADFSDEEIEETIKELKNNTAPGPDGMPVAFYKEFLDRVKPHIKEMLMDLKNGKLDLKRINYGVIILLPKILDANEIKQYRPICLSNVIFKVITKSLTRRLTPVAVRHIGPTQTVFIPGRQILDGVVVLHEILDDLRTTKKSGIIMKLDFERAYDKIQWCFLVDILRRKGFSEL
jgi:hypothetical protein